MRISRLADLLVALVFVSLIPASSPARTLTTLHTFSGSPDGANPVAGVVMDADGNLYGTTFYGGTVSSACPSGCGIVFSLTPSGTETLLYTFTNLNGDGAFPASNLLLHGNQIVGTTLHGGKIGAHGGLGTAFSTTASGGESIFFDFRCCVDSFPLALNLGPDGNLYGTTLGEGFIHPHDRRSFDGAVFRLKGSVHSFLFRFHDNPQDGARPTSGLAFDSQGNIYGTTSQGGATNGGVVFQVTPTGNYTVLYSFGSGTDGRVPNGGLIRDSNGNLYGTTNFGGTTNSGIVFQLSASGTETVLYNFIGGADGANPLAGVVSDAKGNLYGTTSGGGKFGHGTIFKLTPAGKHTVLYSFTGGADGGSPEAGLILDSTGNLYGTTNSGGTGNFGTVFKLGR
jgi:uncharacterized repeat protein (TIGR03803 family)